MATNDGRITDKAPYGQQVELTCKNHPDLRWSTKNIDGIGCRTIFFTTIGKPECGCSVRELIVVE